MTIWTWTTATLTRAHNPSSPWSRTHLAKGVSAIGILGRCNRACCGGGGPASRSPHARYASNDGLATCRLPVRARATLREVGSVRVLRLPGRVLRRRVAANEDGPRRSLCTLSATVSARATTHWQILEPCRRCRYTEGWQGSPKPSSITTAGAADPVAHLSHAATRTQPASHGAHLASRRRCLVGLALEMLRCRPVTPTIP